MSSWPRMNAMTSTGTPFGPQAHRAGMPERVGSGPFLPQRRAVRGCAPDVEREVVLDRVAAHVAAGGRREQRAGWVTARLGQPSPQDAGGPFGVIRER